MTTRRWMLIILTLAIFGLFVARLIIIQIIVPDYIRDRLPVGNTSNQIVKATRGEIVDRNGVPLVSNTLGYDVVIDMVQFPRAERNDIILRLIGLFQENGAEWNDNLPITRTTPYTFLEGRDADISRLKEHLGIQPYTSVDDTLHHLIELYSLEDYPPQEQRLIAGVRYEMEQRGFAINILYTFANDIGIDMVLKIKERSYQLSGVDIQESAKRNYDHGDIAPHIIGRTGPLYKEDLDLIKNKGYALDDTIGKSGIELAMEDELRGQNGERVISLDANGRVISAVETTPPEPGNTVVLTIDSHLQELAQKALEAQIKILNRTAAAGEGREADYGAVVVLNNRTGQVLAAATYPSYNQTTYSGDYAALLNDPGQPLYNRALMGLYAPGSTFKPMVATAALATGTIQPSETVSCGMVYTRFPDYQPRCLSAHGNIGLTTALSVSCNIFFYDVGYRTGIDNLDAYAKAYGLGEPTGIEVSERVGHRSNPETLMETTGEVWGGGSLLQTSIGQLAVAYTPVQMANYAATIANRGDRMKVTLVQELRDYAQEHVVQPFEPVVADRVNARPEDFEAVVRGMVAASRSGSAVRHFGNYPFDVASKTGTPETSTDLQNSTFICFGPAEDPEIAIFVIIEKGWHGYTAAPVAREIMDEYFGIYNANPLVPRDTLSLGYSSDAERVQDLAGDTASTAEPKPAQSAQDLPAASQAPAESAADSSSVSESQSEPSGQTLPERQTASSGRITMDDEE